MIGLICRMDCTGLGQGLTLRLARMLNPDKILLIDSSPFNGNKQYPSWYVKYNTTTSFGFPDDKAVAEFIQDLDIVVSCETFYNNRFTKIAQAMRTKTILIAMPEFMDWFNPAWAFIPEPDKVFVPSLWLMQDMQHRFQAEYLPTPLFADEFGDVPERNIERTGRNYLFMNGKTAAEDRNGLQSLYNALRYTDADFTITIKAQNDVQRHKDPRLVYDFTAPERQADLYDGFDALILPRRYAGLSLPMIEALYCGLPVVMTDIDPNNKVLPPEWLVPARKAGKLMTRILLDVYSASPKALAEKLATLDTTKRAKMKARNIGMKYDSEHLRAKYERLKRWSQ